MNKLTIEERCKEEGIRLTGQRKLIIKVIEDSSDHPNVEELFKRANAINNKISIATIYRTVRLLQDIGILSRLEFNDGKSRYEDAVRKHHDHLIDIDSGEVEIIQNKIARRLGYELVGHKLELYGKKNAK